MLDPYGWRQHTLFKRVYGFLIERRTLKSARLIHFTSPLEERRAIRFGVKTCTTVIPCSLNLSGIPCLPLGLFRAKHPEAGEKKILLFLGRLHPKKRLDRVAEVFAILAQKRADVHLVLAGPDEGGVDQVRVVLRRENLLNRVTFTGLVVGQAKWEIYRDSLLFLLPSEDENFALTVLEAMALGVPVLVSRGVGLADWVEREKTGLVLGENHADWVEAVERLLNDPAARHSLGENGRRSARAIFSTDQVAAAMQKTYASLL